MKSLEKIELQKFYISLQQEIKSTLLTEEEGNTPEQIFTDWALALLADSGETENYQVKYDERTSKRGVEHKINAYALSENYETLDLFVTIFNGTENIEQVSKPDADKAIERLEKFFKNAVYKDYVTYIEESSQIFDLANTLANSQEVKEFLSRVNIFLLSDGEIKAEFTKKHKIAGYTLFYRVVDINYLFNISEKSRIPIEIDFEENGLPLPCIIANNENDEYQSYIAIIPALILANLYEQYGSRLLEQNVRSFLQFTGKINKGIRKTIIEEPLMFLAYNNGISVTAEEVKIRNSTNGKGEVICYAKDFQIVNGGQTTASIYHTWKKDKIDISNISVQLKLSVVKKKDKFNEIVSRISECANTQNKVSVVDLSSNKPFHIALEKLSRNIWAPPQEGQTQQTNWFYERARGQYKNALLKYGFTKAKRKAFELRSPKHQVITKEELAKYIDSWQEIYDGKKLIIGPHYVVRGNQKNYVQFMNYYFNKKPDNIFFEDTAAKAILFKTAERIYGVSPNSIGDMRYITVPYSIAWIGYNTNYKLDLYKIWRNQSISEQLKELLFNVMNKIENFIKKNAPGSLYGEWAKKEECWIKLRGNMFAINLASIDNDLTSSKTALKRKRISDNEIAKAEHEAALEKIMSVHPKIWRNIEHWGRETSCLNQYLCDMSSTIANCLSRHNKNLTPFEIINAQKILDIAIPNSPELFYDLDELNEAESKSVKQKNEITLETIQKIIKWDRKNNVLKGYEFMFLKSLVDGKKSLSEKNLFIAELNLEKVKKHGFRE